MSNRNTGAKEEARVKRHEDADKRDARYAALAPKERLERIADRPGESRRELKRLGA